MQVCRRSTVEVQSSEQHSGSILTFLPRRRLVAGGQGKLAAGQETSRLRDSAGDGESAVAEGRTGGREGRALLIVIAVAVAVAITVAIAITMAVAVTVAVAGTIRTTRARGAALGVLIIALVGTGTSGGGGSGGLSYVRASLVSRL